MRLNDLKPADGSKHGAKRLGRGTGSGLGKTGGRGHKGQRSRSGGFHKVGFEGGQMPLHRRLPKRGFTSRRARITAEVRLHELGKVKGDVVTVEALKDSNIIPRNIQRVKVIASGEINASVTLQGVAATKGARAAIEAAGGKIEG